MQVICRDWRRQCSSSVSTRAKDGDVGSPQAGLYGDDVGVCAEGDTPNSERYHIPTGWRLRGAHYQRNRQFTRKFAFDGISRRSKLRERMEPVNEYSNWAFQVYSTSAPPLRRLLLIASRCLRFQSLVSSTFCSSHRCLISSEVCVRQNPRQSQPFSRATSNVSLTRPFMPARASSDRGKKNGKVASRTICDCAFRGSWVAGAEAGVGVTSGAPEEIPRSSGSSSNSRSRSRCPNRENPPTSSFSEKIDYEKVFTDRFPPSGQIDPSTWRVVLELAQQDYQEYYEDEHRRCVT